MEYRQGIYEELKQRGKHYPETNQRTYVVHPRQYAQFITQQLAREIGTTLSQLAEQHRYDEMLQLTTTIRGHLLRDADPSFHTPLSAIHYRFDDEYIPTFPDMYLTHPAFISNYGAEPYAINFFKALKYELLTADRIDFIVSFIRWSGLQLLIRSLDDRARKGKPIRIITTDYMYVTEPKALRQLIKMDGVQLRLFNSANNSTSESFHTKAYLFERDSGLHSVIIGSSNLSHSALKTGLEWNVKLPCAPHLPIYEEARRHFERIWEAPQILHVDDEVTRWYEKRYLEHHYSQHAAKQIFVAGAANKTESAAESKPDYIPERPTIEPNKMQSEALLALEQTRKNGFTKGVVIAATGTGKTYLAALDAKQFGARSILFLAHRDELLEGAKRTFSDVFGTTELCGKLSGTEKEWDKPFLFSTVQTMHRPEILSQFQPDHFDYMVVDEFHHAQADTYRKIIDYFQPRFLLGLTATPERMDGRDVLELCENNVVYEIRLRDALSNDLLVPFHYFGLADTVNYNDVPIRGGQFDETALVRALATHERVDYIIEMMEKYGYDGERRVALGFCANIDHAVFMANEFNARGYHAAVLTGQDSPEVRQQTIRRLEDPTDPLEIIFTVDVFNEGVDIPSVNLLLFLRPTESATIFLQQLGRGLRKSDDKEYVTVLDFIGNYQKSFVVPLALSGQLNHRAFDRDSLRVAVETEFADLPDGCFVDLEPVAREQILKKIESIRMNQTEMLRDLYFSFKRVLGRSPELEDFLYAEDAPSVHYFISKFGSWVETKKRMEDINEFDNRLLASGVALELVRALEKMLPLKWPYEFALLREAADNGTATPQSVISRLQRFFGFEVSESIHTSYIERSMKRLSTLQEKRNWSFGRVENGIFVMDHRIRGLWSSEWLSDYVTKRIEYGLIEFRRTFHPEQFFGNQQGVVLYQNYTRNDLIFLFQADAKEGSWREGVSRVGNHYLLFVNLNKDQSVAEHLKYRDYFIDNRHFHWQSQNTTAHHSDRGQDYIHHKERGIHIHLFVRKFEKMYGQTLPFTYLGEVDYVSSHGDNPMNITWRLHSPVPDDLYLDLVR